MKNQLDILFSDKFRRSVEENLDRDPVRTALDGRVSNAALVASQVKYLKRAEHKLPSYYAARCILPPLAFEQSSSEATAARKEYSGRVAVDLTCGLGVDAFWLSGRFDRVIAVERDGVLADIARENFRRLGADNISVVNTSAEEALNLKIEEMADLSRIDLVYADPDRRGADGKKLVCVGDCSPDIAALLPRIREIAPRLAVKLSPLFDVDEVFRVFGTNTRVEVVSLGGECKEIIADVRFDSQAGPVIRAVAIDPDNREHSFTATPNEHEQSVAREFEPEKYRYLVVPDVALQKARLARRYFTERGVWIESDNGYGFSITQPEGEMCKFFEIVSIERFDPKELKRRLKAQGIKSIDIMKRDFGISTTDIARRLGVHQGGTTKMAFTRTAGHLRQILIKR